MLGFLEWIARSRTMDQWAEFVPYGQGKIPGLFQGFSHLWSFIMSWYTGQIASPTPPPRKHTNTYFPQPIPSFDTL